MDILLLRSSSRNFPSDLEPELLKAGNSVTSLSGLHAYIASPARGRPQLLLLEIGNVADLDRALMVVEWNDHVQPLAPARYVLLLASKNLTLGDRAAKLGTAEVFALPQPTRNLLFKLELQSRLLNAAPPVTNTPRTGFTAKVEEVGTGTGHRRVLVVRGPGARSGSWQDNGNTPSGKVRWRWVKAPGAGSVAGDELTWTVESREAPRFEPAAAAWVTGSDDDSVACALRGETIFAMPEPPAPPTRAENDGNRSEPFVTTPADISLGPAPPPHEGRISPDNLTEPGVKFRAEPAAAPTRAGAKFVPGSSEVETELKISGDAAAAPPESQSVAPDAATAGSSVSSHQGKGTAAERARAAIEHAHSALQGKRDGGSTSEAAAREEPKLKAAPPADAAPKPPTKESARPPGAPEAVNENMVVKNRDRDTPDALRTAGSDPAEAVRVVEKSTAEPEIVSGRGSERSQTEPVPARLKPAANPSRPTGELEVKQESTSPPVPAESARAKKTGAGFSDPVATPWGARDGTPEDHLSPNRAADGATAEIASSPLRLKAPAPAIVEATAAKESPPAGGEAPAPREHAENSEKHVERDSRALNSAAGREPREEALSKIRPALEESKLRAQPATFIQGSAPAEEDARRFLKTRHFELMTLEQLGDQDSSWQPMGPYRVYFSAQHRYYGLKDPASALPLWVYDGELAPEFIDEQKSWKFYDHLPIRIDTLDGLPAEAYEALYKLCGLEPPADAAPHERGQSVVRIKPSKENTPRPAPLSSVSEAASEGGWARIVRAVRTLFGK